jgi:hypothetical protein
MLAVIRKESCPQSVIPDSTGAQTQDIIISGGQSKKKLKEKINSARPAQRDEPYSLPPAFVHPGFICIFSQIYLSNHRRQK